ncbi:Putative transporter, partial [hydrothermal vent metagenome]
AFIALFVSRDLGFEFGGWLLIHGVTELFAIVIAGGAGMRVGWAIANPGDLSRLGAAAQASRSAALALGGVIIMLFIAGLLEGFGRQLITIDALRYLIAIASALFWGAYFYAGARRRRV